MSPIQIVGLVLLVVMLVVGVVISILNDRPSVSAPGTKSVRLNEFNRTFVLANQMLAKGNTEGFREGLSIFIESLAIAGDFRDDLSKAIGHLCKGLSHHERADTKGPWNRDLSGYGVLSWKNDLYDRDQALANAWPYIKRINDQLREQGLGWDYRK